MEVVVGKHSGQSLDGLFVCRDTFSVRRGDTDDTDHSAFHLSSSGYGRVGIGQSLSEGLIHKVLVRCPGSHSMESTMVAVLLVT